MSGALAPLRAGAGARSAARRPRILAKLACALSRAPSSRGGCLGGLGVAIGVTIPSEWRVRLHVMAEEVVRSRRERLRRARSFGGGVVTRGYGWFKDLFKGLISALFTIIGLAGGAVVLAHWDPLLVLVLVALLVAVALVRGAYTMWSEQEEAARAAEADKDAAEKRVEEVKRAPRGPLAGATFLNNVMTAGVANFMIGDVPQLPAPEAQDDVEFSLKTVNLLDLVRDGGPSIVGRKFRSCVICGPVVVVLTPDCIIEEPDFSHQHRLDAFLWYIPPDRAGVVGAVQLSACEFYSCLFWNVGIASPDAQMRATLAALGAPPGYLLPGMAPLGDEGEDDPKPGG
jgi:hypothetical protein